MSSFTTVAERPLPFAQDAEPGVYLADPSRRLKAYLFEEAIFLVAFVVLAFFVEVNIAAGVAGLLLLALHTQANTKRAGTSFAKKRMNMRVVDAKTFAPLSMSAMIIRRGLLANIVGNAGLVATAVLPAALLSAIGLDNVLIVAAVTIAAVYAYASVPMRNDRNRNVWDIISGTQVVYDKFDTLTTPIVESKLSLESDLLIIEDMNVSFATPRGNLKAVRNVSLSLPKGESLGVVGESGSGKTVLSRATMGLLPSTANRTGVIKYRGEVISELNPVEVRNLWGTGMAMIFQDPMTALNPVRRIGDQLTESLTERIGMDKRAATERAIALLKRVRIPDPEGMLKKFPYQLSGGMRQRIMIAIAVSCNPEMLFADEPTTALDVTVQAQVLELLTELRKEFNMSMILVTHDLGVVAGHTDRIAVMYAGDMVEYAPTRSLFSNMKMPYTEALLKSIPRLETPTGTRLPVVEGRLPDPTKDEPGCAFANRCEYVQDKCRAEKPPLKDDGDNHFYRCWFPIGGGK
jgi:oligopeptide/dipeptide ABC transporter ATP-binding protein